MRKTWPEQLHMTHESELICF